MKIVEPSVEILGNHDPDDMLKCIEAAGRTCYKSEDKITSESAREFAQKIIQRGHESVLEHVSISVRIVCDRGVSHEIVRHRLASYSQESTRYCNYASGRFCSELTFIRPCYWRDNPLMLNRWQRAMSDVEFAYLSMIEAGASPQEARAVLPNSLKTELVMTANLREWRHFLRLRTAPAAHPQMQEIARMILAKFYYAAPFVFDNIWEDVFGRDVHGSNGKKNSAQSRADDTTDSRGQGANIAGGGEQG